MIDLHPDDEHNTLLKNNTHPPTWVNPTPTGKYHMVVIGAGTAGLVTAAGAATLGAKVALIERNLLGGDCLNTGCVPSKAVIRSARVLAQAKNVQQFGGILNGSIEVDFAAVMERMRRLRAKVSYHDAVKRFSDMGMDIYLGNAKFLNPHTIDVDGTTLSFKKAVVATGARAVRLPIDGLEETGYLTNETVFSLTQRPKKLAVIGAGPIGCELAQSFQRLGCEVTILDRMSHVLPREDEEAAKVVEEAMRLDGVSYIGQASILSVESSAEGRIIHYSKRQQAESITVDEILVAVGRQPNVENLGLEAAGVKFESRAGVLVNDRLQTSAKHIYAAGDICMQMKFTHAADAAARIVIQNALFLGRKKLSALTIPRCTYTDPEIAAVGLTEAEAKEKNIAVDIFVRPFSEVDRAIVDEEEKGFVKIMTRKGSDHILGGCIVGPHAGDMIGEISVAMAAGMGLKKLANVIHPYPTKAEAIRQVGDLYNRSRFTERIKSILGTWLRFTGP